MAALENHLESPAVLFDLIEVAYNDAQDRKTFTAMTVIGLIRAQHYMDYDWCMVYEQTDVLRQNQSSFKMDLSKRLTPMSLNTWICMPTTTTRRLTKISKEFLIGWVSIHHAT